MSKLCKPWVYFTRIWTTKCIIVLITKNPSRVIVKVIFKTVTIFTMNKLALKCNNYDAADVNYSSENMINKFWFNCDNHEWIMHYSLKIWVTLNHVGIVLLC